ncbi:hypothetical protein ACPS111642_08600 [Acinetobacter pseudolwoffii]|uniref:Uncharacterized protein n=1 Tax=Acinetobacter pseudolwoffii TaxID=2053287 RepID=A0A2H9YSS6_9GAMM|nr:hypothetical protein CWI32_04765 [Acinetobacter pseudolwoffii]
MSKYHLLFFTVDFTLKNLAVCCSTKQIQALYPIFSQHHSPLLFLQKMDLPEKLHFQVYDYKEYMIFNHLVKTIYPLVITDKTGNPLEAVVSRDKSVFRLKMVNFHTKTTVHFSTKQSERSKKVDHRTTRQCHCSSSKGIFSCHPSLHKKINRKACCPTVFFSVHQ